MTTEHQQATAGEHQPPLAAPIQAAANDASSADPLLDPRALQILTTEHWSLLSARSLAYNEAFSRAGMFLSFLSATLIVIGFLVASDAFGEAVLPIVALLLAVDLFIGLATIGRLARAGSDESTSIAGMNRIRHAYADMVPGIERYFVAPIHDDRWGVAAAFGGSRAGYALVPNVIHGLTTTGGMLMIIVCVLAAALLGVIAAGLGLATSTVIAVGVATFLIALVTIMTVATRAIRTISRPDAMFPTPE